MSFKSFNTIYMHIFLYIRTHTHTHVCVCAYIYLSSFGKPRVNIHIGAKSFWEGQRETKPINKPPTPPKSQTIIKTNPKQMDFTFLLHVLCGKHDTSFFQRYESGNVVELQ